MQNITWLSILKQISHHKKKIISGQLLAIAAVLLSLPIPLLFPLLIDEVLLQKPDWIVGTIDTLFKPKELYVYIVIVFATTISLRTAFFLLNVVQIRLFATISKELIYNLRKRVLQHLKLVSIAEYEALGGGSISSKLVTDINTIDDFIGVSIGRFIISILSLFGIAGVLFFINWQLALIILVLNPIVVTITVLLGRRVRKLKKRENLTIERFQNDLGETLDLFVQIRAHNQERRYIESMLKNARNIQEASLKFGWKSDSSAQFSSYIFLGGFELFRAASMLMVLLSSLSIGEMLGAIGYLWFMTTPLQELLGIIFSYQNATGAMQRLNALMQLKKEPQYPHLFNPFKESYTNSVRLENISFAYGKNRVLHNINFTIPKGKTVALLGASGSGKTTLAHIILGLYATQEGDVFIDDTSVKKIGLDVIREHISLVLQMPRMFNDTLRQNLTLGRDIDDDTLLKSLRIAQLQSVINRVEDGLDTLIGKDGIRLSGGERQRLAIARMLVGRPNVILLDESTSALDIKTETNLFNSLREHLRDKSMLIIAHRLSTIESADLIYILEDGHIVESGTPSELKKLNRRYANLLLSAQNRDALKGVS